MGWDIGEDPDDADFLKAVRGNTRVDLTTGFGPYLRSAVRIVSNIGETYGFVEDDRNTRLDLTELFAQFLQYRFNPLMGLIHDVAEKKTVAGEPSSITNWDLTDGVQHPLLSRLYPLWIEDVKDAVNQYGARGLAAAPAAFAGLSVSTYGNALKKGKINVMLDRVGYLPLPPTIPEGFDIRPRGKKAVEDMWVGILAQSISSQYGYLLALPPDQAKERIEKMARRARRSVEPLWVAHGARPATER